MPKKRRLILAIAVAAPLAAAASYALAWYHDYPVRRFGVVEANAFYRGAQPDADDWRRLREKYGIRTVIDLREERPNEPWAILERDFCARNGIRHVRLPIKSGPLSEAELRTIVEVASDPACRPVYIHCELGKARTGVAVAAYRIVAQGWSLDAALAEFRRYKPGVNAEYLPYLTALAGGEGWRPRPAGACPASAPCSAATP